ncbi:MAG: bifunctional folylpolyglutamate synthase/dihydrofolate synthase, partial [Planctomycetota bacterium]
MHFDDVQDAYDYLYGTFNYERLKRKSRYVVGQTFDLSRIRELDDRLGRPSAAVSVIHVAGTKGKGSTCHMLESVLRAAGYRVGMFTSPHLVDIEERIRLDGANIEPRQFARLVERVSEPAEAMRGRNEQDMPTFFELVTECAFLHFAETRPDVAIVEVGLGGRLDSTNVVTPEVSVITEIGIDHRLELGDTIAQIASEKAGIIKPGLPVVTSAVNPVALEVFHNRAAELGSSLAVSWQQLH